VTSVILKSTTPYGKVKLVGGACVKAVSVAVVVLTVSIFVPAGVAIPSTFLSIPPFAFTMATLGLAVLVEAPQFTAL
jgi:hypothetical protein